MIAKKNFQRFGPIYRDPIPRYHVGARQRSLLTDNNLGLLGPSTGDQIQVAEGDNYAFVSEDGTLFLTLKDIGGNYYNFMIVGDVGAEDYLLFVASPDSLASTPIQNGSASSNYQFTNDNYLRFRNFDFAARWHTVSALADESPYIEAGVASNALATSDANTYNAFITGIYGSVKMFFRRIGTGELYYPLVLREGANPILTLTRTV